MSDTFLLLCCHFLLSLLWAILYINVLINVHRLDGDLYHCCNFSSLRFSSWEKHTKSRNRKKIFPAKRDLHHQRQRWTIVPTRCHILYREPLHLLHYTGSIIGALSVVRRKPNISPMKIIITVIMNALNDAHRRHHCRRECHILRLPQFRLPVA